MPSLEDFREKLNADTDAAMTDYILLVDASSLDYSKVDGVDVHDECKEVNVVFEYKLMDGAHVIYKSAAKAADEKFLTCHGKTQTQARLLKPHLTRVGRHIF